MIPLAVSGWTLPAVGWAAGVPVQADVCRYYATTIGPWFVATGAITAAALMAFAGGPPRCRLLARGAAFCLGFAVALPARSASTTPTAPWVHPGHTLAANGCFLLLGAAAVTAREDLIGGSASMRPNYRDATLHRLAVASLGLAMTVLLFRLWSSGVYAPGSDPPGDHDGPAGVHPAPALLTAQLTSFTAAAAALAFADRREATDVG